MVSCMGGYSSFSRETGGKRNFWCFLGKIRKFIFIFLYLGKLRVIIKKIKKIKSDNFKCACAKFSLKTFVLSHFLSFYENISSQLPIFDKFS